MLKAAPGIDPNCPLSGRHRPPAEPPPRRFELRGNAQQQALFAMARGDLAADWHVVPGPVQRHGHRRGSGHVEQVGKRAIGREARRAVLWTDPEWLAYTVESAKLGALESQENRLMTQVPFLAIKR